ncbi:predicted 3-demethylubiquinone-9 3-methyltransferase (glyoxalase superfamily) [Ureibacillus xyleni]|uniref:Predicted 3-demethylubiquinone-9 3-methyltransferase (Glyoxalase superfamily) n=2 Tax=Ureibacillus xyleni TaxID=614648 RepID=A0A285SRS6_9BACL|nr:VOC family protein [Ureibacillus xyleni]SOC08825.1 predicted 3-demethylubiquinone-9 3-methyltransferase (glyoxalase superfamily) [Ureibacillus xyleni]
MTKMIKKISTNLWFNIEAEEVANFYVSIFKNSNIEKVTRYGKERHELEGLSQGDVMTVEFQLEGQSFVALNGGPLYKFTEAISFIVNCDSQEEIDYFWDRLSEGGEKKAQVCGWLKDRYGVSWQIVPTILNDLITGDSSKSERVMKVLLQMKKINIEQLVRAYNEE